MSRIANREGSATNSKVKCTVLPRMRRRTHSIPSVVCQVTFVLSPLALQAAMNAYTPGHHPEGPFGAGGAATLAGFFEVFTAMLRFVMSSHLLRVIVIAVLALAALIGVIVLVALGQAEGTGFGVITGILGTLMPALVDALAVERRRRTPGEKAVVDDAQ